MNKVLIGLMIGVGINCRIVYASEVIKCSHTDKSFNCVEYVKNYDGDTITFNIPNIHSLLGKKISIRVNGVDTPEKRTKDKCEKELSLYAQKFVESKLKNAKVINLKNISRGKYFRIVADVFIDGENLRTKLIGHHFAVGYDGGTKRSVDWCKKLSKYKKSEVR